VRRWWAWNRTHGMSRVTSLVGQQMSIEHDLKKLRQDDAQATPEWHRAWAKDLRRYGFTKMAEEQEEIARTIERQQREQRAK